MDITFLSLAALLAAGCFCLLRAIYDLQKGRYLWAIAGLLSTAAILLALIPTHTVKIDMPASPPAS